MTYLGLLQDRAVERKTRLRAGPEWIVFLAGAVLFLALAFGVAPPGGGTDVYIFRDVGCNVAKGQGYTATSVPYAVSYTPQFFASYPPGTPLLYSLWTGLSGCGARSNYFYNLLLAALASALTLYAFQNSGASRRTQMAAAILLCLVLPAGAVSLEMDRPEIPAYAALLLLLLMWKHVRRPAARAAAIGLQGVVFLLHPFAGILGGLLFCGLLLTDRRGWSHPPSRLSRLAVLTAGLALAALFVGATALSFYAFDKNSIDRFLQHAATRDSGAGAITRLFQDPRGVANYLTLARGHLLPGGSFLLWCGFASLALSGMLTLAWPFIHRKLRNRRQELLPGVGCVVALCVGLPALLFPGQENYHAFGRALLLAIVLLAPFEAAAALRRTHLPIVLLGVFTLTYLPFAAQMSLVSIETRGSHDRALAQARQFKRYFADRGNPDPRILVASRQYFTYKPYFNLVYDLAYLSPEQTARMDGWVRCYANTKAMSGADAAPEPLMDASDWNQIASAAPGQRLTIFGRAIGRKNWEETCDLYERRKALTVNTF